MAALTSLVFRGAQACALCLAFGMAFAAQPLEYAVKAAYLVKFPLYVEWPAPAFSGPDAPFVLCVIGDDPFGRLLDDAAAGQQVQGRPVVVRRLRTAGRAAGCHLAYLGSDSPLVPLNDSGALVVTDSRADGRGVINFVIRENRVRFTVDEEAAMQNGLAISSKLLSVALAVRPRETR